MLHLKFIFTPSGFVPPTCRPTFGVQPLGARRNGTLSISNSLGVKPEQLGENMSSAQKRPHSPVAGGKQKRRRRNATGRPPKWQSRGAKDERLDEIMKIRRKSRYEIYADVPPSRASTIVGRQETADVARARANSRTLRPSRSPSSSSLPDNGDPMASSNDVFVPVITSNTPKSGSRPPSRPSSSLRRNNRAALRQTYHLDAIHSLSETRRNNQARQWQDVVIPQIIPAFLKNRATTESGRWAPSPQSRTGCQCTTTSLEVDTLTWDRTFFSCLCGHRLTYSRRMLLECIIDL